MQAIDRILEAVEADETAVLKSREALGGEAERATALQGVAAAGIAAIVIIISGAVVWRNFRRVLMSEQALAASEKRFRLLVSGIEDYALFMLDREGRVILWNSGAERMKGYASEEIVG
ncbi:MAG: PAS domain S-box protein, partial [Hyphomicrobiales bacterium]|nr:PAS domain S-box protein [Hyphomicrobiales bacterium]